MPNLLQFLIKYGYVLLFGAAFAEQLGLPLPAVPLLVGTGALARTGEFSLSRIVLAALIGSLIADCVWYRLGWRYGRSVLRLVCRISLAPDDCIRRTEDLFERRGLWALLPAKFVPGLNTAAVPLLGMVKTPLLSFVIFDVAGLMLWITLYTSLGYVFSRQIEEVADYLSRLGASLFAVGVIALAVYVAYKFDQRRRFLKRLSVPRITPEQLKARMDGGNDILIFDTRNQLDRQIDPVRIPGAFHLLPEYLQFEPGAFSPAREIAVYCT